MKSEPSAQQTTPQSSQGQYWKSSHPRIDLSKIHKVTLKDYGIRFLFGGVISVLAALIGHWVTPRFGGLFTAFPAILLASLTLIGQQDGKEASAEDAEGGVAGAGALVVTAAFIAVTITLIAGAASLLAALGLWLILALLLYLLCVKVGWLRTYQKQAPKQPDQQKPEQQ